MSQPTVGELIAKKAHSLLPHSKIRVNIDHKQFFLNTLPTNRNVCNLKEKRGFAIKISYLYDEWEASCKKKKNEKKIVFLSKSLASKWPLATYNMNNCNNTDE